jgi:protein phosphatase
LKLRFVIRFVPATAQHIGTRSHQQDSYGLSDPGDETFLAHGGFVAVVADGMGGLAYGDAASRIAVKTFLEAYASKTRTEPVAAALDRALRAANSAVFSLAVGLGAPGDVGTTLVAVALQPEGLHWISVGDSAIYLFRGGELTLVTTSHIYGRTLDARVTRGEMSAEQARSDPQREALTSYVGASELREVDHNVRPFPLQSGDSILLASDGLFKTILDGEIAATLAAEGDRAPQILVRKTLACKREHQDNVTVCLVRVEDDQVEVESKRESADTNLTETMTWEPSESIRGSRETKVSTPPGLPPKRRLALLLLLLVLFGAAAGFLGWVFVRESAPTAGVKQ